ncbi:MAG: HPr(Ser) kinase/phosphatase [Gammaproteobacteria bacterium]|nr:HPr(Ser) kinase/phosphatase [Gammaproteobacteria bacterium]
MSTTLTSGDIFRLHEQQLKLRWITENNSQNPVIRPEDSHASPRPNLIGYLNLIRPNRIQVLGETETRYLASLDNDILQDTLKQLFADKPAMIILACNTQATDEFSLYAKAAATPILASPLTAKQIIESIGFYLRTSLSEKHIQHGVFMEVMGLGVLLTGPSGIGKSELALELLSRGHRLIADDAPEFFHAAPDTIHGRCPELLTDFIEVRGLGILNVRAMFGDNAVLGDKQLSLIVKLEHSDNGQETTLDRLGSTQRFYRMLDIDIPEVVLPLAPGRDLAVIIEAAVRNHVLQLRGYNAAQDFISRQRKMIQENKE